MAGKPDRRCGMKISDYKLKEAGRVAAQSDPKNITKLVSEVTLAHYPKRLSRCKKIAVALNTPAGRIVISARQELRALAALINAGCCGVTALELSSWAYRLGAYVHTLRHDYGLEIETLREPHDGGWHARYVLHTPCQIIGFAA